MFKKTGRTTTLGVVEPTKEKGKKAESKPKDNPPPKTQQDDKSK